MKPPNKLSVISNADKVYVGKDTTVQDFIDWINWFQAQNYVLNMENAYLRNALKPKPDNVVEIPKPKRKRTRKPKWRKVVMSDYELIEAMKAAFENVAGARNGTWDAAMRGVLAVVRAHDRDGERWQKLVSLATQWPQTVLVVNINIGHDWHTADTPAQIADVVDAAIAAEGER